MTTRGIDVSSYQTSIDWDKVAKAGGEFAIVKVTQGNGYVNPLAREQVEGAAAAGILSLLYHFAEPNGPDWFADARHEAKRLDDIADGFEQKIGSKIFTFLDVERNFVLSPIEKPNWRAWCDEFRRCSREDLDRVVGWYSGKYFTWDLMLERSWENTVLWLALYLPHFKPAGDYVNSDAMKNNPRPSDPYWPDAPLPWARVDIWQDGGGGPGGNNAIFPGVTGPCDVNVFAGSRVELQELLDNAA